MSTRKVEGARDLQDKGVRSRQETILDQQCIDSLSVQCYRDAIAIPGEDDIPGDEMVPPFFTVRALWKFLKGNLECLRWGDCTTAVIHLEQELHISSLPRIGDEYELTCTVENVKKRGTLLLLRVSGVVRVKGLVFLEHASSFCIKPSVLHSVSDDHSTIVPVNTDLFEAHGQIQCARWTVPIDQPRHYAEASGDYNPVHFDHKVARRFGFSAPIVHGLCTLARTLEALNQAVLGSGLNRLNSIFTRFSYPVYPGDILRLFCEKSSGPKLRFQVVNQRGEPVLQRGIIISKYNEYDGNNKRSKEWQ